MKIRLRLTKDMNTKVYDNDEIEIDLEKYVAISVATETGNAPVQACAAHAIAIRTNAYYLATHNKTISDASPQAFNAQRYTSAYQNAQNGAKLTEGLVLYYGKAIAYPASFSANNGGVTTSSKERWGSARGWLIGGVKDEFDKGSKRGHGVGMSTVSARYRANAGHTYQQILSFFYHNTYLHNINTGEDIPLQTKDDEEVEPVAYAIVKASDIVKEFKRMVEEHWPYVAGGTTYKKVDCSGAFTHAYREHGSYMYNGSNTIYRKYTVEKARKGDMVVLPGMAVFVNKQDGKEPSQYQKDGIGNMSHIGCYVGNGLVAEAKGTASGCCYSKLTDAKWTHVAKLKYTDYDLKEDGSADFEAFTGIVNTTSGSLNMRDNPAGKKIGSIPKGMTVILTDKSGDWYKTSYNGWTGWVSATYILPVSAPATSDKVHYQVKIADVSEDFIDELKEYLTSHKLAFSIEGGGVD